MSYDVSLKLRLPGTALIFPICFIARHRKGVRTIDLGLHCFRPRASQQMAFLDGDAVNGTNRGGCGPACLSRERGKEKDIKSGVVLVRMTEAAASVLLSEICHGLPDVDRGVCWCRETLP